MGRSISETNHLLLPLFDLAQGCTLQSENVVPRLTLKEFLLRCLQKFIVYIWTSISLAKMNAYLKKITKEMGLEINPQRIMGQNLCKINKHFLQFPYKTYLNHINCFTFNFKNYHKIFFLISSLGILIFTLEIHYWYMIHFVKPTRIHLLMPSLLNPMNTCQKKIII